MTIPYFSYTLNYRQYDYVYSQGFRQQHKDSLYEATHLVVTGAFTYTVTAVGTTATGYNDRLSEELRVTL